jgi:integrase
MPRKRKPPSYLKHKGADGRLRARTVIRWPGGQVEHRSLGEWGSPESHAEHARLIAEWRAAWEGGASAGPSPECRTINGLLALWWLREVQVKYASKTEMDNLRSAVRPLRRLYGHTDAHEFGPRSLKALRKAMADGSWLTEEERARRLAEGRPLGWSRKYLNRHVWRLLAFFGWAESEELLPKGTRHALETVRSLREGEPVAVTDSGGPVTVRETDDVPPAPEEDVAAVLTGWSVRGRTPLVNPVVRALIELQLLTGARPGELVRLRGRDLQRGGTVELRPGVEIDTGSCWAFAPRRHKTAHKNHGRVILFGPQAQRVLRPFLEGRDPGAYLFAPAEGLKAWRASQRSVRRSPVQPSQHDRSKPSRRRPAADHYTVRAYNRAVGRACARAGVPAWHVHQLRHNAATRLVRQFGWRVAQIVLGHAAVETTKIYALEDIGKAAEAMGESG